MDPNFCRTVVLLVRHGEDGAFGLVVNRKAEGDLEALARSLDIPYGRSRHAPVPLYVGGPVEPERGWILHESTRTWDGTEVVAPGVALSASREALAYFAGKDRPEAFRTLIGYAGWGPGQLDAEIAQGAWEIAPLVPQAIFRSHVATLWEETLRQIGADPRRYVSAGGSVQ